MDIIERNSSTIIVGDLNTLLSIMYRNPERRSIRKKELNLINQLEQTHTEHSNSRIYIFLKSTWKSPQDRPYVTPQNEYKFKRLRSYKLSFQS